MINKLPESKEYVETQISINNGLDKAYGKRASKDGIYYPDYYFAPESNRLVFVLKETYSPVGDFAFSPVLDPDNTDAIVGTNRAGKILVKTFGENGSLSGVGYVNISKKAMDLVGGKTNSKHSSLMKSYRRDNDYLRMQLKAMDPHYVICGGTFCFLWNDLLSIYGDLFYKVKFTSNPELNAHSDKELSLWRMKDKPFPVFIQTYHPSCSKNVFKCLPKVIEEYEKGEIELDFY